MSGAAYAETRNLVRTLKEEAASFLLRNELGPAVERLRRITTLDPSDGMEKIRYGRVLYRLRRFREALDAYRDALDLFYRTGDYRRAQAACGLVLTITPEDSEVRLVREKLRRTWTSSLQAQMAQQTPVAPELPDSASEAGWGYAPQDGEMVLPLAE